MPSIYSRDIYGASHGLRPWRDRSEQKRIPHLHEVDFASLARWVSWGSEKASYLPKVTQWVRGCPSSNLELLTTVPSPFQYKAGKYLTGCQAKKELFGSKCFKCVDSLQQLILETRKWRSEMLGNWPRVTQLVRSRDEMGNLSRPAQSCAFSSSSTWPFKVIIQEMVGFIFILITIVFIFVSGDSTHVWGMTQITLCGMEGSRNEGTDFFNLEGAPLPQLWHDLSPGPWRPAFVVLLSSHDETSQGPGCRKWGRAFQWTGWAKGRGCRGEEWLTSMVIAEHKLSFSSLRDDRACPRGSHPSRLSLLGEPDTPYFGRP